MSGDKLRIQIDRVSADNRRVKRLDTVEIPVEAVEQYMAAMEEVAADMMRGEWNY